MATKGKSVGLEVRNQIIEAILHHGLSVNDVATAHGISRRTVSRFLKRFRQDGKAGLMEMSRRPSRSPQQKPADVVEEVLRLRRTFGWGAAWIGSQVGASASTVHKILCEHNLNDLSPPSSSFQRYEMSFPGELVHVDIKELVPLKSGQHKQHLFAAIDAYSREAFVRVHERGSGAESHDFLEYLLSEMPYRMQAVMTDNALVFTMRRSAHPDRECPFQKTLRTAGITHKVIRPYTPRTNGKVERFFGTVGRELLRRVEFKDSQHRSEAIEEFASYYNTQRPHSAIGYRSPTPYRISFFESVH